jgi:hypothetical protein
VFEFHQLCENAYERITDLAENLRNKRDHLLEMDKKNKGHPYSTYVTNTTCRIAAALAVFKLMERSLTKFDVNLDKKIKYEYLFAKALFNILRDDTLHKKDSNDEMRHGEAIHSSDLDKMCAVLLDDKVKRYDVASIMSLGEFANLDLVKEQSFKRILELLTHFSPDNKRVFWQNLLCYAYICRAICTIAKTPEDIHFRLSLGKFSVPEQKFL